MADTVSKRKRSWIMSRVRSENTKPEMLVRSMLFSLGLRFRLHKAGLPGRPDIVLPKLKAIVFVHGCFWHRHKGCRDNTNPSSNSAYWQEKFKRNVERDKRNAASLRKLGWRVITVWECELKKTALLERRLRRLLCVEKLPEKAPARYGSGSLEEGPSSLPQAAEEPVPYGAKPS